MTDKNTGTEELERKKRIDRKRHIFKAFTWRFIATTITVLLGWIVTKEIKFGLTLGGLDIVIKLVAYYFHERLWYKIDFGIKHRKNKAT